MVSTRRYAVKPTPRPAKATEPAGNLPPGWFKPSPRPARPARENAARFAPADQLDDVLAMLGLAS